MESFKSNVSINFRSEAGGVLISEIFRNSVPEKIQVSTYTIYSFIREKTVVFTSDSGVDFLKKLKKIKCEFFLLVIQTKSSHASLNISEATPDLWTYLQQLQLKLPEVIQESSVLSFVVSPRNPDLTRSIRRKNAISFDLFPAEMLLGKVPSLFTLIFPNLKIIPF